jgi:hypothetical protein
LIPATLCIPRAFFLTQIPAPAQAADPQCSDANFAIFRINNPLPDRKKARTTMKKTESGPDEVIAGAASPSRLIGARTEELDDWRGETLARLRVLVRQADPEVVEEWKWSVPVWSHAGIVCTGETYKNVLKMTFAKGASLQDPSGLFNSSLQGNTRRAIDFREGDKIDEEALKALIRAAVALNTSPAVRRGAKTA